jgi:hypothetical protein
MSEYTVTIARRLRNMLDRFEGRPWPEWFAEVYYVLWDGAHDGTNTPVARGILRGATLSVDLVFSLLTLRVPSFVRDWCYNRLPDAEAEAWRP